MTRGEFEALIRSELGRSVSLLDKTLRKASVTEPELKAVYRTGGSSRIQLVADLMGLPSDTFLSPRPQDAGGVGPAVAEGKASKGKGKPRKEVRRAAKAEGSAQAQEHETEVSEPERPPVALGRGRLTARAVAS